MAPAAATVLDKCIGVALGAAVLVGLPALLKPHWEAIVTFVGGDIGFYVIGITALHLSISLLFNIAAAVAYWSGIADRWKIARVAWPWKAGGATADAYAQLNLRAMAVTAFNILVLGVPAAYLNYRGAKAMGYSASVADWPSPWTIVWQVAFSALMEDTMFYWAHRTLHSIPWLYRNIHKQHHQYYFSIAIAAEYAHPVEFIVGNALPFATGPLLLGSHAIVLVVWMVWRITETIDGHSGLELPWSPHRILPFQGTAGEHDAHHSMQVGNYGSLFNFWDRICGTAIDHAAVDRHWAIKTRAATGASSSASGGGDVYGEASVTAGAGAVPVVGTTAAAGGAKED